eukprot:scaffold34598_cov85-Skeletonema_dohrnii-CCMP3373.AAC.2
MSSLSKKKPRLDGKRADAAVATCDDYLVAMANELSGDVVAIIFGCFPPKEIMHMRRVCKKWREAAKRTIVPPTVFDVNSLDKYNALVAMATALPNLQQITLSNLGWLHKYSDGDPTHSWATQRSVLPTTSITRDINIISNFRKLRMLNIQAQLSLNGRYPVLFNFPLLRILRICSGTYIKVDLEMLQGLPLLKILELHGNPHLIGNLRSLRVLKDTLEEVEITRCQNLDGDFMDLADVPRLKELNLEHTKVTGDIRDIGKDGFPALESLRLPKTVHGGFGYEFQLISDVPSFMHTIHLLLQRTPRLFEQDWLSYAFNWKLSEDSANWYESDDEWCSPGAPFRMQLFLAGSRRGWSWCKKSLYGDVHSCEINWLDSEPHRHSESSDYETYIEGLKSIEGILDTKFFRGHLRPPSELEYRRLCEESVIL